MKLIYLLLALISFSSVTARAANPAIIYGSNGMALNLQPNGIQQKSGVEIRDLVVDPSVVAVDAPAGSYGSFSGRLYVKQDAGSSTNWEQVAHSSDIPVIPAPASLQDTYNNSSSPQITLNASGTGLVIRDNAVAIAAPLFEVMSNNQLLSYLSVSENSVNIDGALVVTSISDGSRPAPSMTQVQRNAIVGPTAGDMVYNTDTNQYDHFNGTIWVNMIGSGIPVMAKGALFASNGVANGEFAPCTDGQILEWDSLEAAGFKCVTPTVLTKGQLLSSDGTTNIAVPACADGEILEYDSAEADGTKCVTVTVSSAKFCSFSLSYNGGSGISTVTNDMFNCVATTATGSGNTRIGGTFTFEASYFTNVSCTANSAAGTPSPLSVSATASSVVIDSIQTASALAADIVCVGN